MSESPRDPELGGDPEAKDQPRATPGGPYFGRLLIVLLAAVLFCGFMTWLLSALTMN